MLPFFLKRDLEKIFINDSEVIKRLDQRRESRNIYDKDLLGRPVKCLDLSNKEEIIPDGRLRINKGSARFECFFHQGNKRSNSKLYILLSAARTARGGRKRAIPQFNRWSWYSNVEDHWLSIEDPMYFNNDEILVGWFYGTAEENYRQYLADIAEYFSSKLGVNRSNVIFYGSSAGGPAALHAAKLFRGGGRNIY